VKYSKVLGGLVGGENTYLKGMEQQLKLVAAKVEQAKIEVSMPQVAQKLEEVNQKFNVLRDEDAETFEVKKLEFEEAFNELSQLVTDNSSLSQESRLGQEVKEIGLEK
jgi:CHASE3 domain sensor protein